MKIEEILIWNN